MCISLLSHGDIIKNRCGVMIFNPIKIANVTVSIIVLCPMSLTILIISGWLDKYNCPRMMDLIQTQDRTIYNHKGQRLDTTSRIDSVKSLPLDECT